MSSTDISPKAQQLLRTLQRLFQYDRADLDFGIYRVLNQRREDIDRFLTRELLPEVHAAFAAAGGTDAATLADQVCSDLERFFARYYDDGDFLSLRRYRADTYAVPYEGEEVLLHWANRDQYYVKTSASLSSLAVRLPDERRLRLEVAATDELTGGTKPAPGEERRFVLAPSPVDASRDDELVVRFAYVRAEKGVKQAALNDESLRAVLDDESSAAWRAVMDGEDGPLAKAIGRFTARNSQDYFIHKDLGRFLRRELDFFIKNEQLHVDEIDAAPIDDVAKTLSRVRVFRRIAGQVIDFLHQVEEFQKRVWLKKKCVLETSWLVTLDRVPEELYGEITTNDAQRQDWVHLLAIDQIEPSTDGPGYSEPLGVEFLRRFPYLVVDTRHFDIAFTDRLLESLGGLDEATTGVIIHGENFQALNLIERRYRADVSCIYIDPPYNTGNDGFLFKDSYPHSSWLSMMADRLRASRELMSDAGVLLVSIDDHEQARLRLLVEQIMGQTNVLANLVWNKLHSQQQGLFKEYHEYVMAVARNRSAVGAIGGGDGEILAGALKKISRANPASTFVFPAGTRCEAPDGTEFVGVWGGSETTELIDGRFIVEDHALREECTLRAGWTQLRQMTAVFGGQTDVRDTRGQRVLEFFFNSRGMLKCRKERGVVTPKSILDEFGTQGAASKALAEVFAGVVFDRPKPLKMLEAFVSWFASEEGEVVLDFFAGSGTTGDAALCVRRDHGGAGRFVLIENGAHFERVLRPRMIKSIHASAWTEGIPQDRQGVSTVIQCMRLEAYEDALDSIELHRTSAQQDLLSGDTTFRRQYLLKYLLDYEARRPLLDRAVFDAPFGARAVATTNGERGESQVDLVATFSLLLGLRVQRVLVRDGVKIVRGLDPDGRKILVLWRTVPDMPNEKLDDWFAGLDEKVKGPAPDVVYVNGDSTLEMVRPDGQTWDVRLLEAEFDRLMFLVADKNRAT